MPDPSVPAGVSPCAGPETHDADVAAPAGSDAIAQWLKLEHIARIEPSLPVWRPRSMRAKALWARTDAKWRSLLAEARAKGRADAASSAGACGPPGRAAGKTNQPLSGGFFHAPTRGRP